MFYMRSPGHHARMRMLLFVDMCVAQFRKGRTYNLLRPGYQTHLLHRSFARLIISFRMVDTFQ